MSLKAEHVAEAIKEEIMVWKEAGYFTSWIKKGKNGMGCTSLADPSEQAADRVLMGRIEDSGRGG
uniref:Uncharacterized protein n=1 Tax=Oryza punctata TaxID=4537 RepID=A0A0E0JSA6_ORYPU